MRARDLLRRNGGQAAVEMALVAPLMVFFILGTLQLTLMHQAKLMLEYAAFSAARAGSVWNGDTARMEKAAVFSLLPTMPTFPVGNLIPIIGKPQAVDKLLPTGLNKPNLLGTYAAIELANRLAPAATKIIKVTTLNPTRAKFGGAREIEFDTEANRLNTQLVIRVNYLYELRIPFASQILWESWFAANAGVSLVGLDPSQPKIRVAPGVELPMGFRARLGVEAGRIRARNCRMNGVTRNQLLYLAGLASGLGGGLTGGSRFYIPLSTTHTMRMQSNPFRRFAGPDNGGCS